jgi:general secretion pathway protein D
MGAAPGVLALAGVFTNPQFQVVLRALDQQKGIDLLSAPRVTAKSGQRAVIQLVREFKYPTQFDPPQIPQTVGSGFTPVTPTTPSAFDTRNLGVELEVEPNVGADGYTIDLNLSPRVTEFDGFINYGSPIYTTAREVSNSGVQNVGGVTLLGTTIFGRQATVLLSENVINQPIFSVRQVTTQVTVYDGQTVVLGGLMREDVQKVEDKTPIIGDIPLLGRLFRTSADQHIKRNLIMFVTANLIDPAGQPLIKEIEDGTEVPVPDAPAITAEAIPGDASTSDIPLPTP